MTHYLDTSALVAMLTEEPHTERVRGWIERQPTGTLAISRWTAAELASALSIKVRSRALPAAERDAVVAAWRGHYAAGFETLSVTDRDFDEAAAIAGRHDLGMRAGDALHLAVAARTGRSLVTLDLAMAAAAPELGIAVTAF